MAPRLKILISSGSKKGTWIYYPFFLKKIPASESPPGSPVGPLGREIPACRAFYISLSIYLIVFLSESPVREPPPCSLTGSPQTGMLHHQSHWPSKGILFILSFIDSCVSARVPKKEPFYHIQEKHEVTIHGAPRRRKAYIQWCAAWFPKGIVNDTAVTTPAPCSLWHDTFHFGWGRPEPH
jgi:hypothetical protein